MVAKHLRLGESEHTIQNWILCSLGIEQYTTRRDKSRKSAGVWIGCNGKTVWYRNNTGATATPSGGWLQYGLGTGGADIIGCVAGRAVALEVKRPTVGKQSPAQRAWQDQWTAAGGIYRVVTCPRDAMAVVSELMPDATFNVEVGA